MLKCIFKYIHIYFNRYKNINTYNSCKIRIDRKISITNYISIT